MFSGWRAKSAKAANSLAVASFGWRPGNAGSLATFVAVFGGGPMSAPVISRNTDGVSRTVYLVGRFAIKTPNCRYGWRFFLRGLLNNLSEKDIWSWSAAEGWEEHGIPRRYLAPVLWCSPGGFILVMARARRTLRRDEFWRVPALMHRVRDLKPDNIGVFGGEWRIVDYGEGWGPVEAELERRGKVG